MEEACQGTGLGRGFVEYWEDGFDRNQFTDTKISTALCLWHISQEMLSHFATQTGNYYQQNYLTQKDLIPFQTAIGEVLNNIHDHSNSPIEGYVFTQFYPRTERLRMAVCDFGAGIPNTVNEYLEKIGFASLTDDQAIKKSMELGFSSFSKEYNQGRGMDNLTNIVKKNNGQMFILSNNGQYRLLQNNNEEFKAVKGHFPGTLINIVLDTKYLPDRDEEIEEEFYF